LNKRTPTEQFISGLAHYSDHLNDPILSQDDLREIAESESPRVPTFSLGAAEKIHAAESRVFGPLVEKHEDELDWTAIRKYAKGLLK
jgi:hypothetical protein